MLNVNGLTTGSSPNASHTKKHRERKTESHAAESHSEQPLLDGGVSAILNPYQRSHTNNQAQPVLPDNAQL